MSHGWVYAAVHDSQSPCARAIGRATTRLARKPCALGLERFHTHVTSPQPWLSLAPTTSRSCSAASCRTRPRAGAGKPRALGAQFTISNPSTPASTNRSEEHTSELQSRSDLVCRLLLEKKNTQ